MVFLRAGFCLLLFALAGAGPTRNSRHDTTDYVKLYTAFPRPVAVFTSSNHTSFKCLTATRTAFDPKVKSATYVWHFKEHSGQKGKDVSLNFFPGDTPGQKFYLDDDKATEFTVLFEYTDYKACAVARLPYENHEHCMLWVSGSVVHNVPKNCLENYQSICDIRVSLVDGNICKDDYE